MLEEDKQKRLERTRVLKMILGKKLGAKKLKRMMLMMEQLTIDDLEMEVEQVEAKVAELMEIGEDRDPRDETNKMELSNLEGDLKEVASKDSEDLVMGTEDSMDDNMLYNALSSLQEDHPDQSSEEMYDAFSNQEGEMDTKETFTNNGDLYDAPSNNEGDHGTKQEEFSDIQIMISKWEAQEEEEKTLL